MEGIDHQLMRDAGGRGRAEEEEGRFKTRPLYMSFDPPLLNALAAIIPTPQLHYSPHTIDLKSKLLIHTHLRAHTHTQIYVAA